jgi:hypothetical protein
MADETKVYRCAHRRAILLAFHGGCFMGGNSGWDAKQNTMLASMGFEVHQLAFPKNWLAWQAWAKSFRWDLLQQTDLAEPNQPPEPDPPNHMAKPVQEAVPVVCLGRSSGGYLACMFAAMHSSRISKLILMAPVLNPFKRASILVSFKANTQQFFQTDKPNQPNQPDHANQPDHKNQPDQPDQPDQPERMLVPAGYNPDKTLLLLARRDENVPAWLFSTAQIRQAVFPGPCGHVALLGCTSGRLKQIIQEFVF